MKDIHLMKKKELVSLVEKYRDLLAYRKIEANEYEKLHVQYVKLVAYLDAQKVKLQEEVAMLRKELEKYKKLDIFPENKIIDLWGRD